MDWSELSMEEKVRNHEGRLKKVEDCQSELADEQKAEREEIQELKISFAAMAATLKTMSAQDKIVIGLLTAIFLERVLRG